MVWETTAAATAAVPVKKLAIVDDYWRPVKKRKLNGRKKETMS